LWKDFNRRNNNSIETSVGIKGDIKVKGKKTAEIKLKIKVYDKNKVANDSIMRRRMILCKKYTNIREVKKHATVAVKCNVKGPLDVLIFKRLNCSFSPLTFLKLRFWPPKKKNYKTAP